jgi:simple sugar transport system substrate-binding protein
MHQRVLRRKWFAALAVVAAASTLAACTSSSDSESSSEGSAAASSAPASEAASAATSEAPATTGAGLPGGSSLAGKTILFQIYTGPDTAFWVPAVNGAQAAADALGVNLDIQYANVDDATQVNQLQTAVAKGVAGVASSLPNNATADAVCAVKEAGIPVVAFNVANLEGDAASCIGAFVGQNFVTAGEVIGQRMVDDGLVKSGDKVFCPVELPEAQYAVQRYQGVMTALDKIGATCELVGVGTDPAEAQTTMVQYLLGNQDVKAIIGLGATPMTVVENVLQESKLTVPVGGFDLSDAILKGIESGVITATVDQQPYSQGFYSVMQAALQSQFALAPSNMDTGGRGLVDKSNVEAVAALVPDYR